MCRCATCRCRPRLYMPLQQHVGGAARPIVLVGQKVLKGQLLAEAAGQHLGADPCADLRHRRRPSARSPRRTPPACGCTAITIDTDGEDRWIETEHVADPFALTPEEIAKRDAAAGIVGLGGATFPSAVEVRARPPAQGRHADRQRRRMRALPLLRRPHDARPRRRSRRRRAHRHARHRRHAGAGRHRGQQAGSHRRHAQGRRALPGSEDPAGAGALPDGLRQAADHRP